MTDAILISVAVLLVPLGGLFAAMDTALLTVSVARVHDLIKDERTGAVRLRQVLAQRSRYVSIAVLLRILCESAATVVAAVLALDWWDSPWALVITVAVMAAVSYVAIGVGPRTLGRQHAYSIALNSALVVQAAGVLLAPITRLLIILGNALTPGKGYRNGPFASEIELREVVDMAQERGVVAADERRMIQSVFDLGDTVAREVMVPRPEMIWIEATKTAAQATSLAVRSGHSRIPVIGENSDDIVGVVYLKDLVQQTLPPRRPGAVLVDELMRPAQFVPDSKPLDRVLRDMQISRNHMAMLVDEYGGIAGLVTIEDVLEEIVGEINDEYDTDEVPPMLALDADNPEAGYRVSSRLPLEDLAALFDVEIAEDDVDTVGGLMALAMGRVPLPGSQVCSHGLRLLAEGAADRRGRLRITSVVVTKDERPDTATADSDLASDQAASDQPVELANIEDRSQEQT